MPGDTADGSSYHGYWAQDIYAVNTNFGSAADLVSLSDALHGRGMVCNHLGFLAISADQEISSISWSISSQTIWLTADAATASTTQRLTLSTKSRTTILFA